jgi:transcriptional regulator with XRE-family HTH domain
VEEKCTEAYKIRKILSINVKKYRKKLGFSQEKLAEATDLSSQTINDIEGCRMWVSDKTITKLARIFHIEAYQLLVPVNPNGTPEQESSSRDRLLLDLEDKVIEVVHQQFRDVIETAYRTRDGS